MGGDWEGLYQKDSDLKYIGECDEYEFEENDKDVFPQVIRSKK